MFPSLLCSLLLQCACKDVNVRNYRNKWRWSSFNSCDPGYVSTCVFSCFGSVCLFLLFSVYSHYFSLCTFVSLFFLFVLLHFRQVHFACGLRMQGELCQQEMRGCVRYQTPQIEMMWRVAVFYWRPAFLDLLICHFFSPCLFQSLQRAYREWHKFSLMKVPGLKQTGPMWWSESLHHNSDVLKQVTLWLCRVTAF